MENYRCTTSTIMSQCPTMLAASTVGLYRSAIAGCVEEVVFRGMLFNLYEKLLGDKNMALVLSSVVYGLAHYRKFDLCTVYESLHGAAFCLGYVHSGYNLAVPVVAHTTYEFLSCCAKRFLRISTTENYLKQIKNGQNEVM